jgi:NitT/TauT family transport system ATP-binding protein
LQRIWSESRKTVILITHSIPEAIFLGDVVFVMTARPGALRRIIRIDMPRPRGLGVMGSAEFMKASDEIRELFNHSGSFD